jgi:hypothetical protein
MTKLTQAALVAVAGSLLVLTPSIASASPAESTGPAVMPLISKWRACDFTLEHWVDAVGDGRGVAHLSATGSTVTATVDLATAEPNTRYDVRVIQTPRPSMGCAPGAPGVAVGSLQTDGAGAGSTTVQGPVDSGATGAWVIVERPAENSQTPAEFYTSGFVASI